MGGSTLDTPLGVLGEAWQFFLERIADHGADKVGNALYDVKDEYGRRVEAQVSEYLMAQVRARRL